MLGSPLGRLEGDSVRAAGLPVEVAAAAAAAGSTVELVGRLGEDPVGDGVVVDLTSRGIGHVASLRDAGRTTPLEPRSEPAGEAAEPDMAEVLIELESGTQPKPVASVAAPGLSAAGDDSPLLLDAGDLELALRYLSEYRVVVACQTLDAATARVVADAATYAGASLVVLSAPEAAGSAGSAAIETAIELARPDEDPDAAFAGTIGRFAAALDRGEDAEAGFRAAVGAAGWQRAEA